MQELSLEGEGSDESFLTPKEEAEAAEVDRLLAEMAQNVTELEESFERVWTLYGGVGGRQVPPPRADAYCYICCQP